jgi:nicotinamide mononucleotide transporter
VQDAPLVATLLAQLRATSPAEAVSVVAGLAYVVLARRRNRWCWVAGAVSATILGYLSFGAALPMQGLLQVWYVGMSVYGWLRWSAQPEVPVTRLPLRDNVLGVLATLAGGALLAAVLARGTQAAWPLLDSVTTLGSLFATWLVARGKLENWLWWIVIDALLVFLFAAQGLVFLALLSLLYVGLAAAGYVMWRRQLRATETLPA